LSKVHLSSSLSKVLNNMLSLCYNRSREFILQRAEYSRAEQDDAGNKTRRLACSYPRRHRHFIHGFWIGAHSFFALAIDAVVHDIYWDMQHSATAALHCRYAPTQKHGCILLSHGPARESHDWLRRYGQASNVTKHLVTAASMQSVPQTVRPPSLVNCFMTLDPLGMHIVNLRL
jgi:hypothetical protein